MDEAVAALRSEWGIHFGPVRSLLVLLESPRPVPVDRLVVDTGLSHRSVTEVLRRLEPWLDAGPHGARLSARPAPPPAGGRPAGAAVRRAVEDLLAGAPARRRQLDHVAATADTCLRRAELMAARYCLDGAHVLCLGDHDLTSLALALVAPGARVSVVDVDDDLLAYADRSARSLGLAVRCWFADLRLDLPDGLRQAADLVFTDPPYTPEGVRLFAARGCEALRRDGRGRLLLCHGHGERQPALGFKAQAALHGLRLLVEELRPGFNRYHGAQAIGGASALYVTRPLPETWRLVEREVAGSGIYSHGPMSVESSEPAVPDELGRMLPEPAALPDLWRRSRRHAAARPERRPSLPAAATVHLVPWPALAPRLLLTSRVERLAMVLPDRTAAELLGGGWLPGLFSGAYRLRQAAAGGGLTAVEAERRHDPVAGEALLARHLVTHPAASVGASLREALLAAGLAGTKNEARAVLAAHPALERLGDARAAELPLHELRLVAETLPLLAGGGESGQSV